MLSWQLLPLRTTVGRVLPIEAVRVIGRASEVTRGALDERIEVHAGLAAAKAVDYAPYLPQKVKYGKKIFTLGEGGGRWPGPGDAPFVEAAPAIVSLRGAFTRPSTAPPRDLWIELELRLKERCVVGGLVFAGLSTLPYYVDDHGESSSNFGLPREWRVAWAGTGQGFVDEEASITRQEPTSHGGVHVFATGPIETDRLVLRLADFPRLVGDLDGSKPKERPGLVIPMLCVFEHQQGTRYRPAVPAGLLAATVRRRRKGAPATAQDGYPLLSSRGRPCADGVYVTQAGHYYPLVAASLVGPGRRYTTGDAGVGRYEERFVSTTVGRGEALFVTLEQSEEHPRCIGGLELAPRAQTLDGLETLGRVRLEVYALDPAEGVSPLLETEPATDKYASLLFDDELSLRGPTARRLRFRRPSSARAFQLVFSPVGEARGRVTLGSLELMQSSYVSVSPRPSRAQHVGKLHYRLVGERLGEDHARLGGARAFQLTVERHVAGTPKEVLFTADSLLELLQSGGRLIGNHRYEETTVEVSEDDARVGKGSFDVHAQTSSQHGWRRSETGDGVTWSHHAPGPTGGHGFEAFGGTEIRTHHEQVGHEGLAVVLDELRKLVNLVAANNPIVQAPNFWPDPSAGPRLRRQALGDARPSWSDLVWRGVDDVGFVGLLTNWTLPPAFGLPEALLQNTQTFIRDLARWIQDPSHAPAGPPFDAVAQLVGANLTGAIGPPAVLLNGLSLGVSGGASFYVGGSASLSASPFLPAMNHSTSQGVTGSISKQASRTGYQYAQHLTAGGERTLVRSDHDDGRAIRHVTRKLRLPGTEKQRVRGAEVHWQGRPADIVVGTVPLGVTLPATAGKMYGNLDESIVVRFAGLPADVSLDVWFDVKEQVLRDDH